MELRWCNADWEDIFSRYLGGKFSGWFVGIKGKGGVKDGVYIFVLSYLAEGVIIYRDGM